MNKTVHSLIIILLCLISSSSAILASDIAFVVEKNLPQRNKISLTSQETTVQLENLTEGETYVLSFGALSECEYSLHLPNQDVIFSNNNNQVIFSAPSDSEEVIIMTSSLSIPASTEAWLSLAIKSTESNKPLSNEKMITSIAIDDSYTADQLVRDVLIGGDCFEVTNIQTLGNADGLGYFSQGSASVNLDEGLIISTGNVNNAVGPNSANNTSTQFSTGSDSDLASMVSTGGFVFDATGIEFDFVPTVNQVSFNYVFASEEYCEFVGSTFNDVFGFFISGPGISGGFTFGGDNIALVPGTTDFVAINSINDDINTAYYVSNQTNCNQVPAASAFIEYDGFTNVLTAMANVTACETYHIRLLVGDVTDAEWDSAVFLEAGSFSAGSSATAEAFAPTTNSNVAFEQCANGSFIFTREDPDDSQPLVVNFVIDPSSTATPGADYDLFPTTITIPAGQSTFTLPINIVDDGITEGQETLIISLIGGCQCIANLIELVIDEPTPLTVDVSDITLCGAGSTTLNATVNNGFGDITYSWSTGGTGLSETVNATTTQTVTFTATDDCGNMDSDDATITILTPPTAELSVSGTTIICSDNPMPVDVSIDFTGSAPWDVIYTIDGVPQPSVNTSDNPYEFQISSASTVALQSVGNNAVTCPGTVQGSTISTTETDVTLSGTPTGIDCNGDTNGSITTTPAGGMAPYTYTWDDATATGQNPTGLAEGTYNVTVEDDNGCQETGSFTVADASVLTVDITGTTDIDCSNPSGGAVNITVSGGTAPYTYLWDSGQTSDDISGVDADTYIVTVTDANLCTQTASTTINENTTLPTAEAVSNTDIDCTNTEVMLGIGTSSTGANISYSWSGPSIVSGGSTATPTVDMDGTYMLTVTNTDNNCEATATVDVSENVLVPTIVTATADELTCTVMSVSLDATGSDSGANFTYSWSGPGIVSGGSTATPTVNVAGDYTLTLTNTTNGCEETTDVNVSESVVLPTADAGVNQDLTCTNASLTLDGTGSDSGANFTYNWSGPSIVSGGSTTSPVINMTGTYTITVTNTTTGCEETADVTIGENTTIPTATINSAGILNCSASSLQLDASGSDTGTNFTYSWSGPGIVSGGDTTTPSIDAAGDYILTVTNTDSGCEETAMVNVQSDTSLPTANVETPSNITCTTTSIQLDGTGSSTGTEITYLWTTSDGNIVSGGTTLNPTVNEIGTYTLTVTDTDSNCDTSFDILVQNDLGTPTADAGTSPDLTCTTTQVTLNGTGDSGADFTILWTTSDGSIVSGETTLTPTVDAIGTYELTITSNINGCSTTVTTDVSEDAVLPTADAGTPQVLTCTTTQVTLDGSTSDTGANFTYLWTTSNGSIVSGETTASPTVDAIGTYSILVTNTDTGCEETATVDVTENLALPTINTATPDELTCTTTSIQLDASGSDNGADYTILWTGPGIVSGANTLTPTVDAIGDYIITITNNVTGCSDDTVVSVSENVSATTANINTPDELTCTQMSIQLDGTGSSTGSGFTYLWTGPGVVSDETTLSPTVNTIGSYTLTVTDVASGCSSEEMTTVVENISTPTADAGTNQFLTCTVSEVSLNGSGDSGANYSILWSSTTGNIVSGMNSFNPVVNEAGTYVLTITNTTNGCSATSSVSVSTNGDLPTADAGANQSLTCTDGTVTLDGTGSDSGSGVSFSWTGPSFVSGQGTLTPEVNQTGDYVLTVTNLASGCDATATVTVGEDYTQPTIVTATPGQISCTNSDVVLNASGSDSGTGYTILWSGPSIISGANSLSPTVNAVGDYTITITSSSNGCSSSETVNVSENTSTTTVNINTPTELTCTQMSVQLDGTGSSAGSGFTYLWTGPGIVSDETTLTPTVNAIGNYTLTVTDVASGCDSSEDIEVYENISTPSADAGATQFITCTTSEVSLDGSGDSGVDFSILWSSSTGNIVSGMNSFNPVVNEPGTYDLTITNMTNGCSATSSVSVSTNGDLPTADAGANLSLTCADGTVTLDGTGSDSGSGVSFSWTGPSFVSDQGTLTPEVNQPGDYVLTVTNLASGCDATATVTVGEDYAEPTIVIDTPGQISCENSNVILNANGSDFGTGYTASWSGPSIISGGNSLSPTVNAAGNYTITITAPSNGCSSSETVNVSENFSGPNAVAVGDQELTCTTDLVQLDGTGSSVGSNFTYSWSGPSIFSNGTTLNPTVDAEGEYTLTVTDEDSGCTAQAVATIYLNTTAPNANAGTNQELTCASTEITLNGGGSTGASIQTVWTTSTGNIVSGANTYTPSVSGVGTYTLEVTDTETGCSATSTVDVTNNGDLPTSNAGGTGQIDCNNSTVQLDGTSSSNGSNYSYSWTTADGNIISGMTSLTPTVDAAGTYTLTVTNTDNSCNTSSSTTVSDISTLPVVDIEMPGAFDCNTTSLELVGTTDVDPSIATYEWTTVDGNILTGANTLTPTVDAGGTYVLNVTNSSSFCSNTADVSIAEYMNTLNAVIAQPDLITCAITEITLDASGSSQGPGILIEWSTVNGNITGNALTLNPTVNAQGTYTLTVTDISTDCAISADVEVMTDANTPTADAGIAQNIDCANTQVTLQGSANGNGNLEYEWTSPNGSIVSGASTLNPVVDAEGTYVLTVTNTDNNCDATSSVTIEENNSTPIISINTPADLDCNLTEIELSAENTGTGTTFTYSWTTSNGNILSDADGLNPTINAAGIYTITATNTENSCEATAEVVVFQNAVIPEVEAGETQTIGCALSEITLSGSTNVNGNITIEWTTTDGNILSDANTLTPLINEGGTYTLTVTNNDNNCDQSDIVVISENFMVPDLTAGANGILDCNTGEVPLTATLNNGNIADFDVEWTTPDGNIVSGENTLNAIADAEGIYTLTVSNPQSGCSNDITLEVTQDASVPVASATAPSDLNCTVSSVVIQGSSSSIGDITYEWSTDTGNFLNGQNTLTPEVNAPGIYTLSVTNQDNNCVNTASVNIELDDQAPTVIIEDVELTCETPEVQLNTTGTTTTGDLDLVWAGDFVSGTDGFNPTVNSNGTVSLTLTDNTNHCTTTVSAEVTASQSIPVIMIDQPQDLNCQISAIDLAATVSNAGANPDILWTTMDGNIVSGLTTLNPTVNQEGTYQLSIYNPETGCEAINQVIITEDGEAPMAAAGNTAELTCTDAVLTLDGSASSTGGNINYNWTTIDGNIVNGQDQVNPQIDQAGTYTLTVSNADNNCESTAEVIITQNTTVPTASIANNLELSCSDLNGELVGSGTGQGNLTYEWTTDDGSITSGQNAATASVNSSGIYTLTVTDEVNGCQATAQASVVQDNSSLEFTIVEPNLLTCTQAEQELTLMLDGDEADYTYTWSTQNGNIVNNPNVANPLIDAQGTYEVTVENITSGCMGTQTVEVQENFLFPEATISVSSLLDCNTTAVNIQGSVTGNMDYDIDWDGPGIIDGETTLTPMVNEPGMYTLTVTNIENGCFDQVQASVEANMAPPITIVVDPPFLTCMTPAVVLNTNGTDTGNNFEYTWTTTNGNISDLNDTTAPVVDAPGIYTLSVMNLDNGCEESTNIEVEQEIELPIVNAGDNTGLPCESATDFTLNGTTDLTGNYSVVWSTNNGEITQGFNTLTPTVVASGIYTLEVTNTATGCVNIDEVEINSSNAPTAIAQANQPACVDDTGSIIIDEATGGTPEYMYSIDAGENFFTTNIFTNLDAGNYTAIVQDLNGCEWEQEVILATASPLQLILDTDISLKIGESYQLEALVNIPEEEISEITWTNASTLSCDDCLEPIATPTQSTNYQLTIANERGCTKTAQVSMIVDKNVDVFVPNAFSPNNDGNNDFLFINVDPQSVTSVEVFQVYDRWGELVYEYYDYIPGEPVQGWDGKKKGQVLNNAVFVWYAQIKTIDGRTEVLEGDVTLFN